MESAASGILAGKNAVRRLAGKPPLLFPETTMLGALSRHVGESVSEDFQPMGANFGVLPPVQGKYRDKRDRYEALAERALRDFDAYLAGCENL